MEHSQVRSHSKLAIFRNLLQNVIENCKKSRQNTYFINLTELTSAEFLYFVINLEDELFTKTQDPAINHVFQSSSS